MKRAPAPWLVAIVGASFLVRTGLGWLRATPVFFPDEYIYTALGRSLAESGRPLIRGDSAHFPALLQPLVTAPVWLLGDVEVAFRVVQAIGALAMSLAAVPVYLLARRLDLGPGVALAVSALATLVPDLVYTSYISSEVLAYPLVLAAVYAATRSLACPTRKTQLAFVGLALLAAMARVQLVVLPVVFALAAAAVGVRERRLRSALREQLVPFVAFVLVAAVAVGAGPGRSAGIYSWLLGFHTGPTGIAHWAALDAMMLVYTAGWVIVPGALIGLWLAVGRPRSRDELAFGVVATLLSAALLLEAGFLQASLPLGGREIQERYVFYVVPLVGLSFALYASRRWPLRLAHLLIAAGLVVMSMRVPLSSYTAWIDGSATLYAIVWLGRWLGGTGDAAAAVAFAVGAMSCIGLLASRRPRLGTPVVLGLAMIATCAASAGAVAMVVDTTRIERRVVLPSDASWVDHARVGRTALVQSSRGNRMVSLLELFWNRSIDRVLLLPGASPIDGFSSQRVRVDRNGVLIAEGRPVRSPLLVDEYGSTIRLRDARLLTVGPTAALWVPTERAKLSLYVAGRFYDGWLASAGWIRLWPDTGARLAGWLSMRLTAPSDGEAGSLVFRLPGGRSTSWHLTPGASRHVRVAVCARGRWQATYRSTTPRLAGLRLVSVKASAPVFTPDPAACSASELAP
jgi:hypothetical protein